MDDASLHATGILIRACAEIEYTLEVYIACHCSLNGSSTSLLASPLAMRRKLEIGGYLTAMTSDENKVAWDSIFSKEFDEIIQCRNAIAHGVLFGIDDDGLYNFKTARTDIPSDGKAINLVRGYHRDFIMEAARKAKFLAADLPDLLSIRTSFDKSLEGPLLPHRKAQKRGPKAGKGKRQP
ncbi:hypothetical protein [uncultured Parasphingorhabdus sp.]|uniref:hypothetical protein n=1 Tax=uncultured Parasphingorhabdus sp. TaxID=2709694 RepID=UPI002AA781BD|nr:hypothetical protein [uncultured Parasphingorhabdus sp.]